jgi:hypothetical protein
MSTSLDQVPNRVLSPEEFQQAQTMAPAAVTADAFPPVPPRKPLVGPPPVPIAPKDAVKQPAEQERERAGQPAPPHDLAYILTKYVAEPILDHPFLTAGIVAAQGVPVLGPAIDYSMMGMMGKDILEYSAQKSAEMSFDKETRAQLEQDPDRVAGEQAAVEAAMVAIPGLLHAGAKHLAATAKTAAETQVDLEHAGIFTDEQLAVRDRQPDVKPKGRETPDAAPIADAIPGDGADGHRLRDAEGDLERRSARSALRRRLRRPAPRSE